MNITIRCYSPHGSDETASTSSGVKTQTDKELPSETAEGDWRTEADKTSAGHLTNAKLDAKSEGGDQANVRGGDSTVLGAGGGAGGLSGIGEKTDEPDPTSMDLNE
ncbi:MAG: hypothetical protein JWP57_3954 [Spirosoma sp.]|nr:hypothetical protein [Spirosoma sp.]